MARQRIRDPLHDLIEFDTSDQFERAMWEILSSREFQRLRRVKQLGFSELVYPGATHSRFAHSIGVFHTARKLIEIIRDKTSQRREGFSEFYALAAALVHDVGHGPYSHAFESVGERLGIKSASHEIISDRIIRSGQIAEVLQTLGSGFPEEVVKYVNGEGRKTVYHSVVASQFDADRLDYMQRDRLMSGSKHSAIDFSWLLNNLDVRDVKIGVDDVEVGTVPTLVISPKAFQAAEAYVLGLFQLYPTIYLHKATRGAEKLFVEMFVKVLENCRNGSCQRAGLSASHPIARYALDPDSIENILALDDSVIWGALSMFAECEDKTVAEFACRLRDRKLFKAFDVRAKFADNINPNGSIDETLELTLDAHCAAFRLRLENAFSDDPSLRYRILFDEYNRSPYKVRGSSRGPTEQIMAAIGTDAVVDLADRSEVVKALKPFKLMRVYCRKDDPGAEERIEGLMKEAETDAK